MRFLYTALAFFLLLLNLAMISSLAHFTPIGVKSGSEAPHVTLEINRNGPDTTSAAQISQPASASNSTQVESSLVTYFVNMISKMSVSHRVWILMSAGLVLILAIPDVAYLCKRVAHRKK
jgi:hypothetical protein